MNECLRCLILVGLLFFTQAADASVPKNYQILYVNGIFASKEESELAAVDLGNRLLPKFVDSGRTLVLESVYNPSSLIKYSDVSELVTSKVNEENYFDDYMRGIFLPNNGVDVIPDRAAAVQINDAFFRIGSEKRSVLNAATRLTSRVMQSIEADNRNVIVVAHSQGNLIAAITWVQLVVQLEPEQLRRVRIVNVANTSLISPNGLDLTHLNDDAVYKYLVGLGDTRFRKSERCFQQTLFGVGADRCLFDVVNPSLRVSDAALLRGDGDLANHGFREYYLSEIPVDYLIPQSTTRPIQNGNHTFVSLLQDLVIDAARSIEGDFANRYEFLSNCGDWFQCKAAAEARGAHLVTIGSADEQSKAIAIIPSDTAQAWIGFNDLRAEGVFEWTTNDPVTYTSWLAGEPNDLFGEDCALILPSSFSRQWNDRSCLAEIEGAIIEYEGIVLQGG